MTAKWSKGHTILTISLDVKRLYGQFCDKKSDLGTSIDSSPKPALQASSSAGPFATEHGSATDMFKRILVVDDSKLCRKTLIEMIKRNTKLNQLVLDEADDGVSAISMVKQSIENKTPYRVIFLDNIMIKMHGPEAAPKIRALGFSGYIYGVTGNVFDADITEFKQSGADEVYPKPMQINLLVEVLNFVFK